MDCGLWTTDCVPGKKESKLYELRRLYRYSRGLKMKI